MIRTVLSLGKMPPANALLEAADLSEPERIYPLEFGFCPTCSLAQITESIPPEELFVDYPYFSSYSDTLVAHAEALVDDVVRRRGLGPSHLAVEVASNDGYLLQHYVHRGVPVLGIDPAQNIAPVAIERGVNTLCAFFGLELAEELVADGTRADVLHANNVLAHVPDVNGFVSAIARILQPDGVVVIETPYVRDLVDQLEFDTIYHEHLFYYSLASVSRIFERNGLVVTEAERVPIHGGSLRLQAMTADRPREVSASVAALRRQEEEIGIAELKYFKDFAERVETLRRTLTGMLGELKTQGNRIAAYGAAAKGAVLLNAFDIGAETVDFVVDRSPHKQGRFMPGVHVQIASPERLLEEMPDFVLLLAWNFADEVIAQQQEYLRRGGRFIVPIPEPRVVGP